jgi:DNA-binding transcriptional ArsR family regulator
MSYETVLPDSRFDVVSFGELVSDPSRVRMLLSLMDARARPATELARLAGVTPQTASFHLQRLIRGGLVRVDPRGRHRYYSLASDDVAEALEAVSLLGRPWHRSPKSAARRHLAHARLCYRHLAGRLGVALLAAVEAVGFLGLREGALVLTEPGMRWFGAADLQLDRSPVGRPCLDWTERRPHLGGPLGAALTEQLFARGWIAKRNDRRALRITVTGRRELVRQLALPAEALTE